MSELLQDFFDKGESERHVLNELLTRHIASKVITIGDTVFDCGANVGFHTQEFANLVGSEGMVHAFEPNPELWSTLIQIPNVRLWPYAVGGKLSVETFFLPIGHDQVGSLVDASDFMGDIPKKILSVIQLSIDSLPEATKNPVSFVKIDVERHEAHALRGMALTLMRDKPVIVFENNTPETESLLRSMGFEVLQMLHAIDMAPELANVVAIHKDKLCEIAKFLPNHDDVNDILSASAAIINSYSSN